MSGTGALLLVILSKRASMDCMKFGGKTRADEEHALENETVRNCAEQS